MIGTGLSNVFCSAVFWSKSAQLSVQLFCLLDTSFALGTPKLGKMRTKHPFFYFYVFFVLFLLLFIYFFCFVFFFCLFVFCCFFYFCCFFFLFFYV